MKFEMTQVARAIARHTGTTTTYEGDDYSGTLKVGTLPIHIDSDRYKGCKQIVFGNKRYTNYKHGGYKLGDLARDIVAALPELRKQHEKRQTEAEKAQLVKDLRAAHRVDPRLGIQETYTWEKDAGYEYTVTFKVGSLLEAGVVMDMLREFGSEDQVKAKAPATVPSADRRYRLVSFGEGFDETFGEEFGLLSAPAEGFLDFVDAVVGSRFQVGGDWFERTK